MIKFRQKEFAAPLVGAGMGLMNALTAGSLVMGGVQMKQASDQAKEAQEQNEKMMAAQKKENERLTKALNNVAKSAASNPQAATQAAGMVGQSKMFAVPSGFLGKGRAVVGDIIRAAGGTGSVGKKVLGLGTAGVATAGTMYAIDKVQTADARKIGMMPKKNQPQQRAYASPSVMSQVGTYAKKAGKYLVSKENLKKAGGWAAIGGALAIPGYLSSRAQFKEQQKEQENMVQPQQRAYANIGRTIGNWARTSNWTKIFRTPKQTITGFVARMGSMGEIGHEAVNKFGNNMVNNSKSELGKKLGSWVLKNPGKANLAVGLGGGSVLTGAYGAGEKVFKKTAKSLDKDAYAYENFQNQQVQQ